tara:strand:- start:37 stop:375 length:339 start_codon:yes stop_codon:yes gene_type:complete
MYEVVRKKINVQIERRQKFLLNHLPKSVILDLPLLKLLIYSTICKKKTVEHFKEEEWEQLVNEVIELSAGAEKFMISYKAYPKIEWTDIDILNQRNCVDIFISRQERKLFRE